MQRIFVLLIFFNVVIWAKEPTIGVLKFKPIGMEAETSNLATILTSTLESSLKSKYGMNLVERAQLGALFEEASFHDDMFADGIPPADFILVANFKGDQNHLVIISKLIDTKTTMAVIQDKLEGNLDQVLGQMYLHAEKIHTYFNPSLSKAMGFLTVESNPSGAEVSIEGRVVGITPLLEYEVPLTTQKVQIFKDGYLAQDLSVDFSNTKEVRLKPELLKSKASKHKVFGFGSKYLQPQIYKLSPGTDFYFFAGMQWENWTVQVKGGGNQFIFGGTGLNYEDQWSVPSDVTPKMGETRQFHYSFVALHLDYIWNPRQPYFTPYFGGGIGIGWLEDRSNGEDFLPEEVMKLKSPLMNLNLGVQLLPASPISLRVYAGFETFTESFTLQQVQKVTTEGDTQFKKEDVKWRSYNLGIELVF